MSTKKPVVNKQTLSARVIKVDELLGSFMGYMPNPDEVLQDTGEAIGIYRSMKSDPRVKSLLGVAKSAILEVPPILEHGEASDRVFDLCEQALKKVPIYNIEKRLLSAIDYGFSAVEMVWENRDGWWLPSDVVLRKPERFVFDKEGRLKYKHHGSELMDLYSQAYKWLVFRFDKDAENPYGTSALKACYWPWKFKKAGAEFWLMAAEKFAVPSILALFESSEPEDKVRQRALDLSELLSTVQSGAGAALANIKDVKLLNAPEKVSEFRSLMEWCDTQIAYGIVAQSLAVQEAEHGTRAQAEVHQGTFMSVARNTCRELVPVLQQVIDWVVELNFGPGETVPKLTFDLDEHASWEDVCSAIDHGIPVSRSAFYDRYGMPEPTDEDDAFVKPANATGGFGLADPAPVQGGKKKARRSPLILS
jgi:phage gp29-like protein